MIDALADSPYSLCEIAALKEGLVDQDVHRSSQEERNSIEGGAVSLMRDVAAKTHIWFDEMIRGDCDETGSPFVRTRVELSMHARFSEERTN